MMWSVMN